MGFDLDGMRPLPKDSAWKVDLGSISNRCHISILGEGSLHFTRYQIWAVGVQHYMFWSGQDGTPAKRCSMKSRSRGHIKQVSYLNFKVVSPQSLPVDRIFHIGPWHYGFWPGQDETLAERCSMKVGLGSVSNRCDISSLGGGSLHLFRYQIWTVAVWHYEFWSGQDGTPTKRFSIKGKSRRYVKLVLYLNFKVVFSQSLSAGWIFDIGL